MGIKTYENTKMWKTVGCRLHPDDYEKLQNKYPEGGKISAVLRALIQMHLEGKINKLEYTIKETIG